MRVLLDTSYLYGLMASPEPLSSVPRRFVEDGETELHASLVSIWEMRLKYQARRASGERKSPYDPENVLDVLGRQDVALLPLTARHVARPLRTPIPHKDPFDEMLLVQAQEEGMRLLTVDRLLADHPLALSA